MVATVGVVYIARPDVPEEIVRIFGASGMGARRCGCTTRQDAKFEVA